MSAPIDFDPQLTIVGADVVPAPLLIALGQVGANVRAIVILPPLTGGEPLTGLRIYRAPSAAGPTWALVDTVAVSPISVYNNLFDTDPALGHLMFYAATVVNAIGTESPQSAPLSIAAYAP
jgi:hypothetical protein